MRLLLILRDALQLSLISSPISDANSVTIAKNEQID